MALARRPGPKVPCTLCISLHGMHGMHGSSGGPDQDRHVAGDAGWTPRPMVATWSRPILALWSLGSARSRDRTQRESAGKSVVPALGSSGQKWMCTFV
jgi:hypothetical protein